MIYRAMREISLFHNNANKSFPINICPYTL